MKRKVKISQCMIVKNEENNIRRALTWCRDIADEQIVVDTGEPGRDRGNRQGARGKGISF